MAQRSKPRAGSLQFYPRKRIDKVLPRVNWNAIKSSGSKITGFIGYKVGMCSCVVKNLTPDSLTKDKRITIPASIIELPPMRIFSVRFYKDGKVIKDIIAENLDKELKKIIKIPNSKEKKSLENVKDFDDIRVIFYSKAKNTGIKKTPDLTEIGLTGTKEEKLDFVKKNSNKDILGEEILKEIKLVDIRGLTKAKGLVGPVKRFGIKLKQHKSEKGRRRPGSLGPWHPSYVTFRAPMAGQMGMFTRIHYNSKILKLGKISEKNINPKQGWKYFGNIKTEYIILEGSIQGPEKRALLLTLPLRGTKKQLKKKYEFVKIEG